MSRIRSDRLWPVLTVLVVLLAGALALELVASREDAGTTVVSIRRDMNAAVSDDDAVAGDTDPAPETGAALDAEHEAARLAARRGALASAVAGYKRVLTRHPEHGRLHAELGFWLLKANDHRQALAELSRAKELTPGDAWVTLLVGLARARLGDAKGAEAAYRQALEIKPGYGQARVALGALLRDQGALPEAMTVLKAAAASGSNEEVARALVELGETQLASGQRTEASRSFDEAINRAPAAAEIRVGIARAYLARGGPSETSRALDILARAAELAPDVPQVHTALARAKEKKGDHAGAEASYERALRLDPNYTYARRRLLRLALEQRDFPRARLQAEYLLRDGPDVSEHHFLAGLVSAREGRTDEARKHYLDAVTKAGGNYPEAYFNLGITEKEAGNFAASIAAYEQAVALRPDYLPAMNNLALACEASGRMTEAETWLRRAIKQDPKYAVAWLNLGELLTDQGRNDEAMVAFRSALDAKPAYPKALLNLAALYRGINKLDDALATYRALISNQPRHVGAWYHFAQTLEASGRLDQARDAYSRALEIDAEHVPAMKALAALEERSGNLTHAQKIYEDLVDRTPDDRSARLALALLRRRNGDLAGCARDTKSVLAEDPSDVKATRLLKECMAPR